MPGIRRRTDIIETLPGFVRGLCLPVVHELPLLGAVLAIAVVIAAEFAVAVEFFVEDYSY